MTEATPDPAFQPPEHESDLMRLPSGEWIEPRSITAIRLSDKANRATGEIACLCYINAGGSWHTVPFKEKAAGQVFIDALAIYRNRLHLPIESKPLTNSQARDLIRDIPDSEKGRA